MLIKIQEKYKKVIIYSQKIRTLLTLKKKVFVFGIVAIPLTSAGAGMTIFIDNSSSVVPDPIFTQESVINLDENINIKFTLPIQDIKHYESVVAVYPKTSLIFAWNDDKTLLTITPKTIWKPQTKYSIAFPHNFHEASTEYSSIFSFETISYPKVVNTNIKDINNQYINDGDEIVIAFDKNINDFDVHAVVRPILDTQQFYNKNDNTLHVRITNKTKNYRGYHSLTLFAKYKDQDDAQFYPINSLTFNTLLPRPDIYPKEFDDRLEIAKESTEPKIKIGKYIDVNLKAQITTLFEDGKFVANFVDSTGAKNTPTPVGEYKIYNKHPYALSDMFGVYLPYWMAFTSDGLYGFHGLIVWPKGHEDMPQGGKESKKNIGNAVSAGCVRHDAQNSEFLYNWTSIGTKVIIY